MDFQPLEKQLAAPSLLVTDYTKMESPAVVWAAFQALDDFEVRKKTKQMFCVACDSEFRANWTSRL
jgi:hypothetical protein